MRISLTVSILFVILCCLALAVETRAQAITSYTSIDYYADTDTLDAYSETDVDWDLAGDYDAYVSLRVLDGNGFIIASGSDRDYYYDGIASVERIVVGTNPDTTYTALGTHKAYLNLWDYYDYYPYYPYYYDNFYFSSFEGQGIWQPWWYYFLSPGFQQIRRSSPSIMLGTTYDADTVTTPGDVEFVNVAVDDGTPVSFESGADAHLEGAEYRANVNVSCGGEQFKVVVKFNLPQYSASCCSAGNSRINVFSTSKFEFTQNPVYGYSWRFFPDTSPPAAPSTSPPLAVAFVRRKADGSGSSNTLRVVVGGSYQSRDSYSTRANVHLICN